MAEFSGYWTTGGSTGHQQASYTQAQVGIASKIYAGCFGFEGVAPNFLNKLAGSVPSANTVQINTGGAMVDGRWYINDSAKSVSIPSAVGSGNTRIDRIVLRCSMADFSVLITRIAGTDAAEPSPPAVTKNSGTTYDIMLYQALVDTGGQVTLTDEREMAASAPEVDDSTIEVASGKLSVKDGGVSEDKLASNAVTTTKILNDAVTNAKLADPYDVAIIKAVDKETELTVADDLETLPVPDIWNGKSVVRLWARLTGAASSSGAVTVRVYNSTKSQEVGQIAISQGSRIGYTTTITNPSLASDDILRIDVTWAGTGAKGLDVQVKVDKS